MKLEFKDKSYSDISYKQYLYFESKIITISWFKEFGDWFIYTHFPLSKGLKGVRFSSAGFMKWR